MHGVSQFFLTSLISTSFIPSRSSPLQYNPKQQRAATNPIDFESSSNDDPFNTTSTTNILQQFPSNNESNNKSKKMTDRLSKALQFPFTKDAAFDKLIVLTALPAMGNLAIVPFVSSMETMWVGSLGSTLALAGQSAATSAYLTSFFLVSFLPTIAAPMIAKAYGSGDMEESKKKISETLFLCLALGSIGSIAIMCFPELLLRLVLAKDSPVIAHAAPYVRFRAASMLFELTSSTGFAAFRGMLDTATPFKISLVAHCFKLVLDPILIKSPLGIKGATIATLVTTVISSSSEVYILNKRGMVQLKRILSIPSLDALKPILQGAASMLIRQLAINTALISSVRQAQGLDITGVSGAAYGIVNQIYTIGFVVHVAMQGCAAALVPTTLAKSGVEKARRMGDRIFAFGSLTGVFLGALQMALLPVLIPMFTKSPDIQQAALIPAQLSCILHAINGPRFSGEGVLMGLTHFRDLTIMTAIGVGILVASLRTTLGTSLPGVVISNIIFCGYMASAMLMYYLFGSSLSRSGTPKVSTE